MKKIYLLVSIAFCLNANSQVVTTLCGNTTSGSTDATGPAASFHHPYGVCADGSGNLFVADNMNYEIRKIVISTGVVTTFAGSTTSGHADGTGAAASFSYPTGVCTDGSGNLYVADYSNYLIRKIVISTGVVSTLAGSITPGHADGTGAAASFNYPFGVCCDGIGNLYVADNGNNMIRKIVIATGVVTTICGSTTGGHADGTGAAASFISPAGIVADASGNLYVADQGNNEIRKVVISTGVVTTFAGSTTSGSADGTGAAASFYYPDGVALDGSGNLYVSDEINNEVRKIVVATGVVTTLCGSLTSGHTDGTGAAASFNYPWGLCIDVSGQLYVSDGFNNEIRAISLGATGIEQFAGNNEQVSVFPNPANSIVNIELKTKEVGNAHYTLYDVNGKAVKQAVLYNPNSIINVADLSEGVYTLSLLSNETVINKRIVLVK